MSGKAAKAARRAAGQRGGHRHVWVPAASGWVCEASFCDAGKPNPADLTAWLFGAVVAVLAALGSFYGIPGGA